jgi:hypothetical protein
MGPFDLVACCCWHASPAACKSNSQEMGLHRDIHQSCETAMMNAKVLSGFEIVVMR